jgi:hypothetical protein
MPCISKLSIKTILLPYSYLPRLPNGRRRLLYITTARTCAQSPNPRVYKMNVSGTVTSTSTEETPVPATTSMSFLSFAGSLTATNVVLTSVLIVLILLLVVRCIGRCWQRRLMKKRAHGKAYDDDYDQFDLETVKPPPKSRLSGMLQRLNSRPSMSSSPSSSSPLTPASTNVITADDNADDDLESIINHDTLDAHTTTTKKGRKTSSSSSSNVKDSSRQRH